MCTLYQCLCDGAFSTIEKLHGGLSAAILIVTSANKNRGWERRTVVEFWGCGRWTNLTQFVRIQTETHTNLDVYYACC